MNAPAFLVANGADVGLYGFVIRDIPGNTGNVVATIGTKTATIAFSSSLAPATKVTAVYSGLLDMYYDYLVVPVTIQVRDSSNNVQTSATTVNFQLVANSRALAFANTLPTSTCTPSPSTGYCTTSLSLNVAWFNAVGGSVVLQYGISGNPLINLTTLILHTAPSITVLNDVVLAMPQHALFQGSTFAVNILAQGGYQVSSYTILLVVSSGLSIASITTTSQFSIVTQTTNAQTWGVQGIVQVTAVYNSSDGNVAAATLVTVNFVVTNSATVNSNQTISCTVADMTDIRHSQITPRGLATPVQASMVDRYGTSASRLGLVYVSDRAVTGLLAYTPGAEFVNLAMLTNTQQTYSLTVLAALMDGTLPVLPAPNLNCISDASYVLQVSSTCGNVFLNGQETAGSETVSVTVKYSGPMYNISCVIPFRVWAPQFPITMHLDDAILNPVANWTIYTGASCVQRYQSSTLVAYATMRSGLNSVIIDVTSFIQGSVSSNNTAVATFLASTATVTGVSPGIASLSLVVGGTLAGQVVITVSSISVTLTILELKVVSAISLTGALAFTSTQRYNTNFSLLATMAEVLNFEGQLAYVYARVSFSDGTSRSVTTATDGLVLTSLNASLFIIQNTTQEILLLGQNGIGPYLRGDIYNGPNCPKTGIGRTKYVTNLSMTPPTSVTVTGFAAKLTYMHTSLQVLNSGSIPTNTTMVVTLNFPGSRTQIYSTDARTIFNCSMCNGLFSVVKVGSVPYIVANDSATVGGNGVLWIQFMNFPTMRISITVQLVVVSGSTITANTYPTITGTASKLASYGNSGVYQQARLVATLLLSDGTTRDISNDAKTTYDVLDYVLQTVTTAVVSIGASQVVSRVPGGVGAVNIKAYYTGARLYVSSPVFLLNVTSVPVALTSFQSFSFVASLTGESGFQARPALKSTFSDGSQFVTMFDPSLTVFGVYLPGLVTFTSSVPAAASVNSTTGVVTLLANYYNSISLKVFGVTNVTVSAVVTFFANLNPAFGDVDMGATTNNPIPAITSVGAGVTINIPVRINVGVAFTGGIDLSVFYNSTYALFLSGIAGAAWSGSFIATVNTIGTVNFGGAPIPITGTAAEIAILSFKILPAAAGFVLPFTGIVNTLATAGGSNIVGTVPRSFAAGAVSVAILGVRRRSSDDLLNTDDENLRLVPMVAHDMLLASGNREKRGTVCVAPPCSTCVGSRDLGDTNADCVFDINDVTYTQAYVLAQSFSSPSPPPPLLSVQYLNLDANQVCYSVARVLFFLFSFFIVVLRCVW